MENINLNFKVTKFYMQEESWHINVGGKKYKIFKIMVFNGIIFIGIIIFSMII